MSQPHISFDYRPSREVSADEYARARDQAEALSDRARRWPHFRGVESRVIAILRSHPDFKHGPVSALMLFKAYRLALAAAAASRKEPK